VRPAGQGALARPQRTPRPFFFRHAAETACDLIVRRLAAETRRVLRAIPSSRHLWPPFKNRRNQSDTSLPDQLAVCEAIERLICLKPHIVNKLLALFGPGETYSDVILRLVELLGL
jgi:hypothetical protein